MDAIHARYDPVLGRRAWSTSSSGSASSHVFTSTPFSDRRWSCSSSRSSCARSIGRRGCGATSPTSASPSRSRSSTRAARPRGDDRRERPRTWRASCARRGFRVREATDDDGDPLRLRRPPPVHEDGDALHPPRADPVPRRGGRDVTVRRRAGPRRAGGRVADRPADRHARAAARQEPGLRGARASRPACRPTSRPTSRCTRTARRSPARRSGSTTRCRSVATRSTRTASGRRRTSSIRDAAGKPLWDGPVPMTDVGARAAVRDDGRPGPGLRAAAAARPGRRGTGASCSSLPYRIVGEHADGTPEASRTCGRHRCSAATRASRTSSACRCELTDFGEYTLLIAKRDPGQAIVWLAFASLIAGIAITFYLPRRRVWARITPDGRARARLALRPLRRRRAGVRPAARRPRGGAARSLSDAWRPSTTSTARSSPRPGPSGPASSPATAPSGRSAGSASCKPRVPAFDALETGDLAIIPGAALAIVAPRPGQIEDLAVALARARVPAVLLVDGDTGSDVLAALATRSPRPG